MKAVKHKLSASKVSELKKELAYLESKGRKEIEEQFDTLKNQVIEELDNPYISISDERLFLETRIHEIEEILANTEILDENISRNADTVEIGSIVKVGFEHFEVEYTIVDPIEADPLSKKIASDSPVGKALIGHKLGDSVDVEVSGIKRKYWILKIK